MTKDQALKMADRMLHRHLAVALANYQERLAVQGVQPEFAVQKLDEYRKVLAAWKQRSLAEIGKMLSKMMGTVH